ncbi:hypothetical protein TUMEXPCC7403_05085 [Tumidithrix helvetica PCC 7403]|uniref:DUF6734 family protein n=1 Tax=Tumidithrix helvetica TaxID=3457545 RepID=UPI003C94509F
MKIVWSFWPEPLKSMHGSSWPNMNLYLCSWVLSVMTAKQYYRNTALVTNSEGKSILVDRLGLEFSNVSTELDVMVDADPEFWALGKIYAYRAQNEPFIHIDSDVFLWKKLPDQVERADVIIQNPEFFIVGEKGAYYIPDILENECICENEGWLPQEWLWYRATFPDLLKAFCCGIYGGNRLDFIHYCANLAINIIDHPVNKEVLKESSVKQLYIMLLEQFLPAACYEYHFDNRFSKFLNLKVDNLFSCVDDAYFKASRLGFTHLIAGSKRNTYLTQRLLNRVQKDYPEFFETCKKMSLNLFSL